MPKITLPDGNTIDVDLDAIAFEDGEVPSGFITTAQHEATIKSRLQRAERSARTKLATDDDFWKEVATARGLELRDDDLMPKGASKDTKQLEERWRAQHLAPLQNQFEAAQKQIQDLRQVQLQADIMRHADGVKKTLRDAFIREAASRLSFDEETGAWVVKEGDAAKFTSDGKPMGAEHVIQDLRQSQPDWFQSDKITGSGFQGTDAAGKRTYSQADVARLASDPTQDLKTWNDMVAAQSEGRITD